MVTKILYGNDFVNLNFSSSKFVTYLYLSDTTLISVNIKSIKRLIEH